MMTDFWSIWGLGNTSHETGISDVRLENSDTRGPNPAPDNVSSSQAVVSTDGSHKSDRTNAWWSPGLLRRIGAGLSGVFRGSSNPPVKLSSYEVYQQSIRRMNDYEKRKEELPNVQCEVYYGDSDDMEFLGFPRGKNKVSRIEIERQYRAMSRKHHTDKWGGTNDGFQKLTAAKDSLLRMVEERVVDDDGNSMSQLDQLIAKEKRAIVQYQNNERFEKGCQETRADISELKSSAEQRAHEIRALQSQLNHISSLIEEFGVNVDEEPDHNVGPSLRYDRNLTMFQSDTDVSDSDSNSTELDLYWRDAHGYNDTSSQDGNPS